MPATHRIVHPCPATNALIDTTSGESLFPPAHWAFLQAGDAPLTKSVKNRTTTWLVQVRHGKRLIARGVWADRAVIDAATKELEKKRSTPEYQQRRTADLQRKQRKHRKYVETFYQSVLDFLAFPPVHHSIAERLACAVTELTTPIGSGTVARTSRLPLNKRAEAAVIAWLRHHTTGYDQMHIARRKGLRREVRRRLAQQSITLLDQYRAGQPPETDCPLQRSLAQACTRAAPSGERNISGCLHRAE